MIKILIVEDDPNIAKLIEATVAIGGYEGIVCGDGAEAFEKTVLQIPSGSDTHPLRRIYRCAPPH